MKSIGALQWLAKLISRTEENSFRIGELEYIYMEFTLGPTWCKISIWTYRLDLHKYRWSHKKNLHWILTVRSHCKAFTFAKQNLDIFFGKWNLVKSQRLKKIVHGNWRHACFKTQFERKLIDSSGTFLSHQKNGEGLDEILVNLWLAWKDTAKKS